jgi:polyisoprenoid-binding protein YceI
MVVVNMVNCALIAGGMIRIDFLALALSCLLGTMPVLKPTDTGSRVSFTIRNFGLNVDGSLSGLGGEMSFDPKSPQTARFDVYVKAASIKTGNRLRDDHLIKKDYLNAVAYPEIRFRSTSVSAGSSAGAYMITGMLTLKGVSKEISFPFRVEPRGTGYVFKGSFQINRRDFGVGGGSISLSDNLTMMLQVNGQ